MYTFEGKFERKDPYFEHIIEPRLLNQVSGLLHYKDGKEKFKHPFSAVLNESFIHQKDKERAYFIPEPYQGVLHQINGSVYFVSARQLLEEKEYDKDDMEYIRSTFMYNELKKTLQPHDKLEVLYYWERKFRYFKSEELTFLKDDSNKPSILRMEDVSMYVLTEPYRMLVAINGREEFFE